MKQRLTVSIAAFTAILGVTASAGAFARDTCRQGYVWREAFPGDRVCVTPQTREQAARDNEQAARRRQPGGGGHGPDTCRQGYVWREARAGDLVCVAPGTRSQTAHDNAQAGARRASAQAPGGAPADGYRPAAGYRLSGWSGWGRGSGVEYRYRMGVEPQNKRYATDVDAIFEVRNPQRDTWEGAVRTLDCSHDVLRGSRRVVLRPNETKEVKFLAPNCGSQDRPSIRPDIARSHRID